MSDISPSDNTPEFTPTAPKFTARVRSIANSITAVTALIVAISGLITMTLKKFEEKEAKTGYEEVSKVIDGMNAEITRNHENLMELRNYLDGYFKSQAAFLSGLPAALRSSISTAVVFDSKIDHPYASAQPSSVASLNPPRPELPVPSAVGKTPGLPSFDQIKETSAAK